jgi:flagellar motility protein MotE (MotC chaperone)
LAAKDQELDSILAWLDEMNKNYKSVENKMTLLKSSLGEEQKYSSDQQNKKETILVKVK